MLRLTRASCVVSLLDRLLYCERHSCKIDCSCFGSAALWAISQSKYYSLGLKQMSIAQLLDAAENGDIARINRLIDEEGIDVNGQDEVEGGQHLRKLQFLHTCYTLQQQCYCIIRTTLCALLFCGCVLLLLTW